jgi:hypothetical protein
MSERSLSERSGASPSRSRTPRLHNASAVLAARRLPSEPGPKATPPRAPLGVLDSDASSGFTGRILDRLLLLLHGFGTRHARTPMQHAESWGLMTAHDRTTPIE